MKNFTWNSSSMYFYFLFFILKLSSKMPMFWNYIAKCPYFETRFDKNRVMWEILHGTRVPCIFFFFGLSFCPVVSGYWMRWIHDMCPRLDTCRESNVSSDTSHWTEIPPFFFFKVWFHITWFFKTRHVSRI